MYLQKEKAHLSPLPRNVIRKPYQMTHTTVKVNSSCMITYRSNQYSVPPKYLGKRLVLQVYDNYLYVYYNTELIVIHPVSTKKLNYTQNHYVAISKQTFKHPAMDIEKIAKKRYSTYFIKCHDLIMQLKKAKLENRLEARLKHFFKYKLLIIDELGYLPIEKDDAKLFFQLIDKRYEKRSTIITTNINFNSWDEVFFDPVIANAILDRVLHHAHVVNITGKSYRLKKYTDQEEE